jgi:hypothetical protein
LTPQDALQIVNHLLREDSLEMEGESLAAIPAIEHPPECSRGNSCQVHNYFSRKTSSLSDAMPRRRV